MYNINEREKARCWRIRAAQSTNLQGEVTLLSATLSNCLIAEVLSYFEAFGVWLIALARSIRRLHEEIWLPQPKGGLRICRTPLSRPNIFENVVMVRLSRRRKSGRVSGRQEAIMALKLVLAVALMEK